MTEALSKGNLKSQIKQLSTKLGESPAKGSATENNGANLTEEEKEKLKQQLDAVRRKKLTTKMFHVTKALRSNVKKCKAMEIQKQLRKLKEARKALEESNNEKETTKKHTPSPEDIPKYEKELDILKDLDVEAFAEKTLRNKILKHKELKRIPLVIDVLNESAPTTTSDTATTEEEKTMQSAIDGRILRHKSVQELISTQLDELQNIFLPTHQQKQTKRESNNKDHKNRPNKKMKTSKDSVFTASSMFVDSLGGDDDDDDNEDNERHENARSKKMSENWVDKDFDKFYNGEKKKNRPGQRQRRQEWEKKYGKDAKHVRQARDERIQNRIAKGKPAFKAKGHDGSNSNNNSKKDSGLLKPEEFHPSWQAKRQEQMMIASALSGKGNANNKIVFDDSE